MPATVDSIINAAKKEWIYWGESTWDLTTHSKRSVIRMTKMITQYVIDHYCKIGEGSPSKWAIRMAIICMVGGGNECLHGTGVGLINEIPF
jgi:hypothetical protein